MIDGATSRVRIYTHNPSQKKSYIIEEEFLDTVRKYLIEAP